MAERVEDSERLENPPRPPEPRRDAGGRPLRRIVRRPSLEQLLAGITPDNTPPEFDSGPPVGNEQI
ncbi:MAG: hypothetical protein K2W96_02485 [Gemmataceae bacterium]|nr:hypothetical protein [Gemmataceae bacterium]